MNSEISSKQFSSSPVSLAPKFFLYPPHVGMTTLPWNVGFLVRTVCSLYEVNSKMPGLSGMNKHLYVAQTFTHSFGQKL